MSTVQVHLIIGTTLATVPPIQFQLKSGNQSLESRFQNVTDWSMMVDSQSSKH